MNRFGDCSFCKTGPHDLIERNGQIVCGQHYDPRVVSDQHCSGSFLPPEKIFDHLQKDKKSKVKPEMDLEVEEALRKSNSPKTNDFVVVDVPKPSFNGSFGDLIEFNQKKKK